MIHHYRLALTAGVTMATLIATVSLGFWTGLIVARLPSVAFSPPSSGGS